MIDFDLTSQNKYNRIYDNRILQTIIFFLYCNQKMSKWIKSIIIIQIIYIKSLIKMIGQPSQIPKYKKIVLQELQERPQIETKKVSNKDLIYQMNWLFEWQNQPIKCYKDSGIDSNRIFPRNGVARVNSFFDAFLNAYTQHGDVALIPDEVWIMILFYVSKYIDENALKLRPKLVKHQGVKILNVVEHVQNAEQSLLMENNWDHFFDQIINQIEKNTHEGIVETFSCNFSTTTKLYKTISTAITMNSLKKLFNYHRSFCVCGINNVYMAGEREDWAKMIPKLESLAQFDVNGELKTYIDHMKIILINFLQTFDGKPDLNWWNTVMQSPQKRQEYGGDISIVDGWILNFFGKYEKTQFGEFPEFTIKVPILLTNQATNTQKKLLLVSDFVSISKLDQRTYKPDVGLCIFDTGALKITK